MTKRAAIYARVSTDDQADKGYSLPSQLDGCRQYIDQLGYSVVAEFRDDHSGATPVADRAQGKRLTEMIKFREVDAVVVHQVDRLSRDIVDLLGTVRNWLRVGVEVYALDVGKIESELDIVLVIKGWQGSDERKKIRERSMRGKRAKARTGRVVGARPPYGYDHVRDENGKIVNFEPIEEEAQIVRLIFQWYVIGDETGNRLSAAKIAKRLSLCRYQLQVNQTLATAASESRACGVHLQFSISSLVRPMQVYGVLVSALVQPEINAQRRMD